MKITPSMLGAMSGKLGGLVAARNKGGQYFRRNAMPTNPQTPGQTANRTLFGANVNAWIQLTDADKVSWNVWAANVPFLDALGQTYHMSGQQAFIRAHSALVAGGPGPFETAPTLFDNGMPVIAMGQLDVGAVAGQVDYGFTIGAPGASEDGCLIVYVSRPQSLGKSFFKGPYQLAFINNGVNSTDQTVTADDVPTLMDWALAEDDYVHVRARILYADGRLTGVWSGWRTVGANVP